MRTEFPFEDIRPICINCDEDWTNEESLCDLCRQQFRQDYDLDEETWREWT